MNAFAESSLAHAASCMGPPLLFRFQCVLSNGYNFPSESAQTLVRDSFTETPEFLDDFVILTCNYFKTEFKNTQLHDTL